MNPEDLEHMEIFFPKWRNPSIQEIAMLSPNETQYRLIQKIFPNANISVCTIKNWNLNNQSKRHYDLICAMNVFHYAKQPAIWFENVLNACRYFWIQDIINRWRSKPGCYSQFGYDGDSMRYSFLPEIHSDFEGAFDLSKYKEKIIDFHAYPTKCGPKSENMNFVCCMKGNCTSDNIEVSNKTILVIHSLKVTTKFRIERLYSKLFT